jgi:hypothetical protein
MAVTNYGRQRMALWLGGSSSEYPSYFVIGSGSGVELATDTALVYVEDKQIITTADVSGAQKVKWTVDWNSIEMSGLVLREFGLTVSGAGNTGSVWSRTGMPAIIFDGTNELRIEEIWEVY